MTLWLRRAGSATMVLIPGLVLSGCGEQEIVEILNPEPVSPPL